MVEYAMITVVISVAVVLATLLADLPGALNVWATDLGSCVADSATC
jgi:Flp pilus assembly pilin Flp